MIERHEEPLINVTKRVDFRTFFVDRDLDSNRAGDLLIACPNCGRHQHCQVQENGAICFACGTRWGIYRWLTEVEEMTGSDAAAAIRAQADAPDAATFVRRAISRGTVTLPDETVIEAMETYVHAAHNALTEQGRDWWYNRGVSDMAIERFGLGMLGGGAVIPCRTADGTLFTVKTRWLDNRKVRYTAFEGSHAGYAPLICAARDARVGVIVGGEIKALALWSYCQSVDIDWNVIGTTTGESSWNSLWNTRIAYADLALWPDRDEAGEKLVNQFYQCRAVPVPIIQPEDYPEAKAVDDYILAGGNPIREIGRALKLRGYRT